MKNVNSELQKQLRCLKKICWTIQIPDFWSRFYYEIRCPYRNLTCVTGYFVLANEIVNRTVCPKPILYSKLLYKMGHYCLDRRYVVWSRSLDPFYLILLGHTVAQRISVGGKNSDPTANFCHFLLQSQSSYRLANLDPYRRIYDLELWYLELDSEPLFTLHEKSLEIMNSEPRGLFTCLHTRRRRFETLVTVHVQVGIVLY